MNNYLSAMTLLSLLITSCASQKIQTGLDNVDEYRDLFAGKRIGIITNHTGYNQEGEYISDVFQRMDNVSVTALFGPEHGIRGDHDAGAQIKSAQDSSQQIPIYSLYGPTLKPTLEMLSNVDVLVFDIQDIGARFYTYIWTMALAMEASAEQGIKFIVLDRPNPINGTEVEGTILEPEFATFVGLYPIPVRHGMTIGELALLFNGEGWLKNNVKADLHLVPIKGWNRSQWYDGTNLIFIPPSPNIPNFKTTIVYPGMCLWEGTNVSEGRGTYHPFRQFGAPWINKSNYAKELNALELPGVQFEAYEFTPQSIPGMSSNPKYKGQLCNGVKIEITDRKSFEPFWTGVKLVEKTYQLYSDSMIFNDFHFDRLSGTSKIRQAISNQASLDEMRLDWDKQLRSFNKIREKYLLY